MPVSSRCICQARSKMRCTSLTCAPKCVSGRGFLLKSFGIGRIIDQIGETCTWNRHSVDVFLYKRDLYTYRVFCRPGVRGSTNKNAPQDCEAFGAENETRTISCNILIINDLKEFEKTSGETWVKLSWLFRTYGGSDLNGHLTPIKTTSVDFKHQVWRGREDVCLFPAAIRSSASG